MIDLHRSEIFRTLVDHVPQDVRSYLRDLYWYLYYFRENSGIKRALASRKDPDLPIRRDRALLNELHDIFLGKIPDPDYVGTLQPAADHSYLQPEFLREHGVLLKDKDILELGAGSGKDMVLCLELGAGSATGIDLFDRAFLERKKKLDNGFLKRITFLKEDLENCEFPDSSFDLIYSVASLEHFKRPDRLITQYMDALRPGGFFYFTFGPIFPSPEGAHLSGIFKVPYLQDIFDEDVVHRFLWEDLNFKEPDEGDHSASPYGDLNRWTLAQYERFLFSSDQLETVVYKKHYYWHYKWLLRHFDLLQPYGEDDLFVSNVSVILKKLQGSGEGPDG